MSQRTEIAAAIRHELSIALDPIAATGGFVRRPTSLTYLRRLGSTEQRVNIDMQSRPRDNPSAAGAIYPKLLITIPEVEEGVVRLFGPTPIVTTYFAPIAWTSKKQETGRWYIYQSDSVGEAIRDIARFWQRYLIEFLDALASSENLLQMRQTGDERFLPMGKDGKQRLVAAALVAHGEEEARDILTKEFPTALDRRVFKAAFEKLGVS